MVWSCYGDCWMFSKEPEVFFRRGERDVLKFKAIQACHGNFQILEETDFGPFVRAN